MSCVSGSVSTADIIDPIQQDNVGSEANDLFDEDSSGRRFGTQQHSIVGGSILRTQSTSAVNQLRAICIRRALADQFPFARGDNVRYGIKYKYF